MNSIDLATRYAISAGRNLQRSEDAMDRARQCRDQGYAALVCMHVKWARDWWRRYLSDMREARSLVTPAQRSASHG